MSKIARKVERPRPLKLSTNQNRHSLIENKFNTSEDIIGLIDAVSMNIMNGNYDQLSQMNIISLCKHLKTHGQQLENIFKDQLDRLFFVFRNAARDDRLDYMSRIYLLEVIELRAANWINSENINSYYKQNISIDLDLVSGLDNSVVAMSPTLLGPSASPTTVQPPVLAPGEVIKPSGKFSKPTKIPGKNYCKDEVVIRNSDSGKVMGIKGRRVHMIEELSETIISFQRVNPGAKERLVQITGPNEGKINDAKLLIEDTIRRNASPVRIESCEKEGIGGSSSSLNSSASDESNRYSHSGIRRSALHHSFSTNDANIGEYKYTVTIGNDTIKITGTNLEVVKTAKLVLDDYFSGIKEQYFHSRDFLTSYEDEEPTTPSTLPPVPAPSPVKLTTDSRVSSLDSGATSESEETYKAPPSDSVDNDKRESERSLDYSARNRKTSHSLVKDRSKVITKVEKEDTAEKPSPSKRITYSQSELVGFLASALSRGPPDDWDRICKNVSAITRKVKSHSLLPDMIFNLNALHFDGDVLNDTYYKEDCMKIFQ